MIFPKMCEIATRNVVKVDSKVSLQDTIEVLKNSHHRSIIVTKGKDYYLFSANNLIQMKLNENNLNIKLEDIPLTMLPQIHKDSTVIDAMELVNSGIRLICIVEDDRSLFGIVTNSDIISSIDPETLMDNVKIKDYFKKHPIIFIDKNQTLFEAISCMNNHETDCILVTDNGTPKGILTSKDTISIISNNVNINEIVDLYCSYPLQTIPENFTIKEAVDYVNKKQFKRIVAVDHQGNITGIISQQDLISYSYSHWAAMMKDYHDELLNLNKQLREKSDELQQMVIADKKKELQLIEQQKELETIFNTTKDGIAVLDMDTRFTKVNKAYCEMTGLSEDELFNTSFFALAHKEDILNAKEKLRVLFEKGFIDSYEKRCVVNGRILTIHISLNLLPDGKHILLNMKDISKFKTFEAQTKLASMGEMIGNIAHQWRQPLTVILTTATGIGVREEMGMLNKDLLLEGMNSISEQVTYLSKTIDDFRNFIKDSNNQEKLSIKNTIEKTISIVSPAMKNHNIQLIVDMVDDMEIIGYENELIQAFINIINNGRDAIDEHMKDEDDSNNQEKLSIKNTIEKTISIVSPAMKNHNIQLIVDMVDDMEIIGYENELIQAFINIINNGRDAIDEHMKDEDDKYIFITTRKTSNAIIVTIKDSGGGIPDSIMPKIFEPYFTTKHQSIGTGIGLSMTHKIITEHHKGRIEVHNEEYEYDGKNYKGAFFEITFY